MHNTSHAFHSLLDTCLLSCHPAAALDDDDGSSSSSSEAEAAMEDVEEPPLTASQMQLAARRFRRGVDIEGDSDGEVEYG